VFGSDFPASTMVQVVALARPELLIEINATAVISN
jgi:enamine deaminase RidA (YjgF/YER057c/UK114 family)